MDCVQQLPVAPIRAFSLTSFSYALLYFAWAISETVVVVSLLREWSGSNIVEHCVST